MRGLPEVGHLDDVLVADGRGGARLAAEALEEILAPHQLGLEHLGGEALAEPAMLDLVDRAHPARRDVPHDPILVVERRALGQYVHGLIVTADRSGRQICKANLGNVARTLLEAHGTLESSKHVVHARHDILYAPCDSGGRRRILPVQFLTAAHDSEAA